MKQTMIKALKFVLCLLPVAALGGLFTGMYTYASYTEDVRQLLLAQTGSYGLFLAMVAMQSVAYAAFCGFFGYLLSDKLGLMGRFALKRASCQRRLSLPPCAASCFLWITGPLPSGFLPLPTYFHN